MRELTLMEIGFVSGGKHVPKAKPAKRTKAQRLSDKAAKDQAKADASALAFEEYCADEANAEECAAVTSA